MKRQTKIRFVEALAATLTAAVAGPAFADRDPARGLGFGIDFTIPSIDPDMEANDPRLPHCDVSELRADVAEVRCEQGWLRGNSPDTVELEFPGLYDDERVTIRSTSRFHEFEASARGDEAIEIPVSERTRYKVIFEFYDGSVHEIDLSLSFYPVAP